MTDDFHGFGPIGTGNPARTNGDQDEALSDGPPDHGEAVAH